MGKPKCDPEMYGTNLLKVGHELCPECKMLVALTKSPMADGSVRPLVMMQDGMYTSFAELVQHRYYEHRIIPIGDFVSGSMTNLDNQPRDLRVGQEKWYDKQVRKGLTDKYEWIKSEHNTSKMLAYQDHD